MGAALRTLSALPAHSERGEFFASVYVVGYLAFSVPAIIAGIAIVHAGLVETTVGYGLGISLLALVAMVNALRAGAELVPAAARVKTGRRWRSLRPGPPANSSAEGEGIPGAAGELAPDGFWSAVLVDRVDAVLPAEPLRPEAAERHAGSDDPVGVDPHGARPQRVRTRWPR